jgi:hypothetical protein
MTETIVTIAIRKQRDGSWLAWCPFCRQTTYKAKADAAPVPWWSSHTCKGKR